eukprot:7383902-Prymnesium_polylepis.1
MVSEVVMTVAVAVAVMTVATVMTVAVAVAVAMAVTMVMAVAVAVAVAMAVTMVMAVAMSMARAMAAATAMVTSTAMVTAMAMVHWFHLCCQASTCGKNGQCMLCTVHMPEQCRKESHMLAAAGSLSADGQNWVTRPPLPSCCNGGDCVFASCRFGRQLHDHFPSRRHQAALPPALRQPARYEPHVGR